VKSAKPTSQVRGELKLLQCFYALPTFTNSVSLTVTSPSPADKNHDAARHLWQYYFHREESRKEKDEDRDRVLASVNKGESEEEEAGAKATPVPGIGDEAFWVHSFVGNLYVRKGDEFFRISLGGKFTDEQRLSKAKELAADALLKLK
jgi:hypothetical protein